MPWFPRGARCLRGGPAGWELGGPISFPARPLPLRDSIFINFRGIVRVMTDLVEAWNQHVRAGLVERLRARGSASHRKDDSKLPFRIAASLAAVLASIAVLRGPSRPLLGLATLVAVPALGFLYEALRERRDERSGVSALAARAEMALSNGAPEAAAALAERGLASASSGASRRRLVKALAWAGVGLQDPVLARRALFKLQLRDIDVHLFASYLAACDRVDEAVDLLEVERRARRSSRETTKLLADLRFRRGEHDALMSLLRNDGALLSAEDRTAIQAAADRVQALRDERASSPARGYSLTKAATSRQFPSGSRSSSP